MSTKIEWTDQTWNPVTGCHKVSQGCKNCYAETMHRRLKGMGQPKYSQPFREVTIHPKTLTEPYKWKKNKMVFVNSMSDLFHKDVPVAFIEQVFKVIEDNPQHTFQILTKRSVRLTTISHLLKWPDNLWMGVSIESREHLYRISDLIYTGAKVKFLSLEPLLEPMYLNSLNGIDWVIVGGESGHNARPMLKQWVDDILNQCRENNVPFFFKQWGGTNKKRSGRELNGRTYDEMPNIKPKKP